MSRVWTSQVPNKRICHISHKYKSSVCVWVMWMNYLHQMWQAPMTLCRTLRRADAPGDSGRDTAPNEYLYKHRTNYKRLCPYATLCFGLLIKKWYGRLQSVVRFKTPSGEGNQVRALKRSISQQKWSACLVHNMRRCLVFTRIESPHQCGQIFA